MRPAPATDAAAAIEVAGLRVVRGGREVLALDALRVATGSVTGLMGPSGCGKTTFMRAVVGVQQVASGSVRVLGRPAGEPGLRLRVAYMTQAPSVYPDLTVEENLRFFAGVLGAPGARVGEVLEQVDLDPRRRSRAADLSGGELQRVSLAASLLGRPELLVLDEPTVGLDPLLRIELWALFAELAAAGATLLISSHSLEEARHCEDLLLLRDGALVATGSPEEIRRRTGAGDLEEAFVALVRRAAPPGAGGAV